MATVLFLENGLMELWTRSALWLATSSAARTALAAMNEEPILSVRGLCKNFGALAVGAVNRSRPAAAARASD